MDRKPVNEHFFDKESKEMWYILGVSFYRYTPERGGRRNTWTSADHDLLEIVKTSLQSGAKIGRPTSKGSRNFQFSDQYLQDQLMERGCINPKSEREFPRDCEEKYLNHFVRGFFDGSVSCCNSIASPKYKNIQYKCPTQSLSIFFNISFLKSLYSVLEEHTNIKSGKKIKEPLLRIDGRDVIAVHNYIYRDWKFMQKRGLYLPSKKEKFSVRLPI